MIEPSENMRKLLELLNSKSFQEKLALKGLKVNFQEVNLILGHSLSANKSE